MPSGVNGRVVMSTTKRPGWYERLRIRVPLDCSENFSGSTIKALVDRNIGLSSLSIDSDHPAPEPVFKCGRAVVPGTVGIPNLGDSTIHFVDIQSRIGILDLRVFAAKLQLHGVGGTNNSCKHRCCENSNGPHSSGTDVNESTTSDVEVEGKRGVR